ncbi:polysaccharide biosynthesis/export family protein [Qipengyuania flava]|uniref:polysaccharide biosynthesis/export family protein n=1 Tax=Qipengyuania flava TaxID=192812 RepID=UPI001C634CCC|nr:polysaccharide biosynthesis/export family protein [Qipengyuania flava]QYJ06693.1 polysaccharide export protein [Qipengyuania flava]
MNLTVPLHGLVRWPVAALAGLALAGCQAGLDPVVPAGQAGYSAIATDASNLAERYALAPGDVVSVRVYDEADLSVEDITLDNAGVLSLPLIGDVRAAGQTATELARSIEAAYAADYLRDPRVSVLIKQARVQTIAVEGEVTQPGVFPYQQGQTLLTALALARSPTDTAKLDHVIVFRTAGGERQAGRFDVQAIRGGAMPDVDLLPGDTVVVGYSATRGAFLDAVRAIPIIGVFRPYP